MLLLLFHQVGCFASIDSTAESGAPAKEATKKSKTRGKGEAVSKKLLAAGHKIKQACISG